RRSYSKRAQNGENLEDVIKRVREFIEELIPMVKEKNINVAISCHGNSIRGFRSYFENLTPEEVSKIETPLGSDYLSYNIK
ncbi:2,3-bisphosphoglycerate-dependent phosphoglycerate mutase, partial [bacterium]|nr:2,3-bisphosphoglycerate-dependent phosphoglycerate mutase [bacterium]